LHGGEPGGPRFGGEWKEKAKQRMELRNPTTTTYAKTADAALTCAMHAYAHGNAKEGDRMVLVAGDCYREASGKWSYAAISKASRHPDFLVMAAHLCAGAHDREAFVANNRETFGYKNPEPKVEPEPKKPEPKSEPEPKGNWVKYGQLIVEADVRFNRALIAYADNNTTHGDDLIISAGLVYNQCVDTVTAEVECDVKVAMDCLAEVSRHRTRIMYPMMIAMHDDPKKLAVASRSIFYEYITESLVKATLEEQRKQDQSQ
jgi:hypothetical protein